MRAHEAGALHGQAGDRGPAWLNRPDDVNELVPHLWATHVSKVDGVLTVAGESVTELATEFGTPLYVLDEDDFRRRARAFREAFDTADVYYAGKAFLSVATARWVAEEGLNLDVCTGGELAVAMAADFPPARIGLHGNNKSVAELRRALELGVGRIIVDSVEEIDRLVGLTEELGVTARVMVRVTAGVEAHTHEYISTAHEDQKFGFSIHGREGRPSDALQAVRRIVAAPGLKLLGLHSHIGSQIFVTDGFEVAARRVLRLQAEIERELGVTLPEFDLGGGFGIAYTTQDDPRHPQDLAREMVKIVHDECGALDIGVPKLSIEPGRAIVGPSTFTLYEVGTTKEVALDGGASRRYVAVDGGMSDNIRTALYSADYSATLASRSSEAPAVLSRVVGKHCESGDIVVKDEYLPADVAAGDLVAVPGTGAYCRSLASNYNHVPRAAVVAVREGEARLILRRETEDDLLRLDVI
ncbi:diaminopimelate decarboxylase [Aeromicrobium marinum DSM 15272]|uniref:Diaminopimelate decarboxylase n=1 Tax=Aeromicrobium marinum DSM 15272 TaxID=585531 RepID=E2SCN3_9ACTN|nr:diaminopimelate decarboxylase [Aeromicrobium marinum]EFQ82986.1 diaminopimelate decarboxylase [Aeromicrobium marinum DSM 15272]